MMNIPKEDIELLRNVIMSYCEDNPEQVYHYNEGERLDNLFTQILENNEEN